MHAFELCYQLNTLCLKGMNAQLKHNELTESLKMLRSHERLRKLDLSFNSFSHLEHETIISFLNMTKYLKVLVLKGVKITDKTFDHYLEQVTRNKNIG